MKATDILSSMFSQGDQTSTTTKAEAGGQTKTTQTDIVGTSSAPPPFQSMPPKP